MKPHTAGRPAAQDTARVASAFQQAVSLHRQGRPFQADALCAEVLRVEPRHSGAWHLRGLLALEGGDVDQGIEWIERSLKIQPDQAAAHSNLGNALLSSGRPQQALASFDRALGLKSDYVVALYNRGNAFRELHRFDEALASYDEALRLRPDHAPAHNNRGWVLLELARLEAALAAFERAVELDPNFADAHRNRAAALLKLERPADALASYDHFLQRAQKDVEGWCGRGNVLLALKRPEEALESYTRAVQLDSQHVDALINRGHALQCLRRPFEALTEYEGALRLRPDCALALNNSGNALVELGRAEEALARYDKALQLSPGDADTLYNRGAALRQLGRHEESAQTFAEVVRIAPERDYALGNLFHLRMDSCNWTDYEVLSTRLYAALAKNKRVTNPLSLLLLPGSRDLPLACTRAYVDYEYPQEQSPASCAPPMAAVPARRIRVAYVSADFREHPTSYLMVGVLERHDREAFEIIGVSLRDREDSEVGRRVYAAFDRFIEVKGRSDRDVAELLREMDVDIAVDLMGLTEGLRLGIFAHRAAPVQVSYLGYPATTGARFMDYLLADSFAIPPESRPYYAEQVVYLPECYQANDDRCPIGARPTRAAAGLPERGVVFCCFNNSYKLNPTVFDVWMRLLREEPDSVLWILAEEDGTRQNLLREAAARGVTGKQLVFAGRVPYPDHLGRLALADLFLDTLPYNAGATASDALRMHVPVLTCVGELFVSRMAGSLLTAVGLPELITQSLTEYESKALELARYPEKLSALRAQLARNLTRSPLFNTVRFCRHLEAAYLGMYERAARGAAPLSFAVAASAESP